MNLLALLFSQARSEVLRLLFSDQSRELYLRDLTRQSGLSLATMQGELQKLSDADLVTSRRDGNRRYYRANANHPLFTDLHRLVLKTSGLRDVLAQVIEGLDQVEIAFIFGSIARGTDRAASDVDLFVIGNAGLRALAPRLRAASEQIHREINPVTMTIAEFVRGRATNPFLEDVMKHPKIFVKGAADELAGLG